MSPTMKVFFFLGAISLLYGGLKTDAADSSTDVALSRSLGLTVVLGAKQYYVGISQRINWYRAIQICSLRHMTLAAIESETEYTNLSNYLFANFILDVQFWISGSNLGSSGQYTWLASGSNFNYTHWARNQPNNYNNRNRCVVTNTDFDWAMASCSSEHYFICSRPTVPSCGANGTCLHNAY